MKREVGVRPFGEVAQPRSELRVRERGFHGQPGPPAAQLHEVDLETGPMAEVTELQLLALDVGRPVRGAQQGEGWWSRSLAGI